VARVLLVFSLRSTPVENLLSRIRDLAFPTGVHADGNYGGSFCVVDARMLYFEVGMKCHSLALLSA